MWGVVVALMATIDPIIVPDLYMVFENIPVYPI